MRVLTIFNVPLADLLPGRKGESKNRRQAESGVSRIRFSSNLHGCTHTNQRAAAVLNPALGSSCSVSASTLFWCGRVGEEE